jgi:hypothetical protein
MCDQAYRKFAAIVARPMSGADEEAARRLFFQLTDWEAALGSTGAEIVRRLPREFATALVQKLQQLVAAKKRQRKTPEAALITQLETAEPPPVAQPEAIQP